MSTSVYRVDSCLLSTAVYHVSTAVYPVDSRHYTPQAELEHQRRREMQLKRHKALQKTCQRAEEKAKQTAAAEASDRPVLIPFKSPVSTRLSPSR